MPRCSHSVLGILGATAATTVVVAFIALGNFPVGRKRRFGQQLENDDGDETCAKSENKKETPVFRRRLGLLERWYVAQSRSRLHTGFMVAVELTENKGSADWTQLFKRIEPATIRISSHNAWLRAKLRRDGISGVDENDPIETIETKTRKDHIWGDDFYLEVKEFLGVCADIRLVVENDIEVVMQEEGKTPWNDEDPKSNLWRVTLVIPSDNGRGTVESPSVAHMIVSFHHMICDGLGALRVVESLVKEVNSTRQEITIPQDIFLPPPMEDIMDSSPLVKHLAGPVFGALFPKLANLFWRPHWRGFTIGVDFTREFGVRCSQMKGIKLLSDSEEVQKFLTYCRKYRVSPTSVLISTLATATTIEIEKEAEAGKNGLTPCFRVEVAASERSRHVRRSSLEVDENKLGTYVSGPAFSISSSSNPDLWEFSKDTQKKLAISLGDSHRRAGLLQFIDGDWMQFARDQMSSQPNAIGDSFEFSNLGFLKSEKYDFYSSSHWKITDLWFAQGRRGYGAAMTIGIVGPPDGSLNAVLASFPDSVPYNNLESIARTWSSLLQNLALSESKLS